MTRGETLRIARAFLDALDANDAEGVRAWMVPGATWWVDTGLDRIAGRFDHDPGDDRPWPLHGEMDAGAKSDLLAGVRDRFPGGVRQHVRRGFAGGDVAVLEVAGDGMFRGERPYRNRYCFVIRVADGRVAQVREYLDTRHAASVFEGRHLDRRTHLDRQQFPDAADRPTPTRREDPNRSISGPSPAVRVFSASGEGANIGVRDEAASVGRALMAAITAADEDAFRALFTPDATWWADGGTDRRWSNPEGPVDTDPELLVVGKVLVSQRAARIPGLRQSYRGGLRIEAHRIVVDDDVAASGLVCVEAVSEGCRIANDRMYQNRYAFVLRLDGDRRIDEVREYCDTQHAFDVYELAL